MIKGLFVFFLMIIMFGIITLLNKLYRRFCVFLLMKKRACLTNEAILAFYPTKDLLETDILKRWNEIADILGIHVGYLRPDDRLNKIVKLGPFTDDRIEDLSDRAIELNDSLGLSLDLQIIDTVDDYVKAFSAKKNTLIPV